MNQQKLDALLIPISRTGSATYDLSQINTWQAPVSSNAGLPAMAINVGYTNPDNLPVGVEIIGRQFAEGTLVEIAYAHEQNSPPRLIPVMPEANNRLEKLDIPAYNNLLTEIGYRSYIDVLKKSRATQSSDELTPAVFKTIVNRSIEKFLNPHNEKLPQR